MAARTKEPMNNNATTIQNKTTVRLWPFVNVTVALLIVGDYTREAS